MLVFTTYEAIQYVQTNFDKDRIFNFSSLKEGFSKLNLIQACNQIPYSIESKEFDIEFAKLLLEDNYFIDLMKIIIPIYYGKNIFLLIDNNSNYSIVAESLQKFIQERYGLLSYIIYDAQDFLDIYNRAIDETEFSINGLYNLDIDKNRYIKSRAIINDEIYNLLKNTPDYKKSSIIDTGYF